MSKETCMYEKSHGKETCKHEKKKYVFEESVVSNATAPLSIKRQTFSTLAMAKRTTNNTP